MNAAAIKVISESIVALKNIPTEYAGKIGEVLSDDLNNAMKRASEQIIADILDLSTQSPKPSLVQRLKNFSSETLNRSKRVVEDAKKNLGNLGKSSQQLEAERIYTKIPDGLKQGFSSLKTLDGEEFVNAGYKEIVKHLGLNEIAPEKIVFKKQGGLFQGGGFDWYSGEISFDPDIIKSSKDNILGFLRHELEHFKQSIDIFRTEGTTFEAVAEKLADDNVKRIIKMSNEKSLESFMNPTIKAYKRALEHSKGEEFLEKQRKIDTAYIEQRLKTVYSPILDKVPEIKAGTPEAEKSQQYLNAFIEYEGIGITGASENYRQNLLEQEAYKVGDEFKKVYQIFDRFYK